jgi:hypothetical protein
MKDKRRAYFLVECTGKVEHDFVGETEWRKEMTACVFALSAISLVILTPGR